MGASRAFRSMLRGERVARVKRNDLEPAGRPGGKRTPIGGDEAREEMEICRAQYCVQYLLSATARTLAGPVAASSAHSHAATTAELRRSRTLPGLGQSLWVARSPGASKPPAVGAHAH